jgi:hypothetical protein
MKIIRRSSKIADRRFWKHTYTIRPAMEPLIKKAKRFCFKSNLIIIWLNLVLLVLNLQANDSGTNDVRADSAPDFAVLSYDDADAKVNEMVGSLIYKPDKKPPIEYFDSLVSQLRGGRLTDEKKVLVIYLLGELHASDLNSINVLIENIDLKAPRIDPRFDIVRWGDYPAEEALVRIGKPAINPILDHLLEEKNKLRRHLMCEVLLKVEGKEAARMQMKQRFDKESDISKRANIELALQGL